MCVFGSLFVMGIGFSKCDNGFSLGFPFLDSHGVMGLFYFVERWIARWFLELGEVASRKFPKTLGIP